MRESVASGPRTGRVSSHRIGGGTLTALTPRPPIARTTFSAWAIEPSENRRWKRPFPLAGASIARRAFPEFHAHPTHRAARSIEHRRRLVGCWVHAALAFFAPHKAQVREESLHGRFESACRLGAFPTRRFESARRLDARVRMFRRLLQVERSPLGDLRKARERRSAASTKSALR